MAKVIDITDKLTFDGNPSLMIKGKKLEVNADAPTMLKVMNFMTAGGVEINQINEAYELIFPEKSRKEIEKFKLNFEDWRRGKQPGGAVTRTTICLKTGI